MAKFYGRTMYSVMNHNCATIVVRTKISQLKLHGTNTFAKSVSFDDRSVSLVSLDMSHNHLHQIPFVTFHKLTNLKFLNLSHNQLESIESGTFSFQKNLITLNLAFNMFKVIDLSAILPHLGVIEEFQITGNPLYGVSGYKHQLFPRLMWTENFDIALPLANEKDDIVKDEFNATAINSEKPPSNTNSTVQSQNGLIMWMIFVGLACCILMIFIAVLLTKQMKTESSNPNASNWSKCRYDVDESKSLAGNANHYETVLT